MISREKQFGNYFLAIEFTSKLIYYQIEEKDNLT